MGLRRFGSITALLLVGCNPSAGDDGNPFETMATGCTAGGSTTGGPGTTGVDLDTTADGSGSTGGGPKLDVGSAVDLGGGGMPGTIPTTCATAEQFETTVGCRFYALDLDNYTPWDESQWGVAVANVQEAAMAEVVVEVHDANGWQIVAGPQAIAPKDLHVFALPDRHQEGSGVQPAGAYRVTADVPVIAYQFDPLGDGADVGWASADASLLHPAPSWDTTHHIVGMGSTAHLLPPQGAYVTVVAAHDGTVVTVTPSVATLAGPGVPAGVPGVPFDIMLDEGDVLEVMTQTLGSALTGTRVQSNDDHPVGVFTAHECANIPADVYACDHLEEQMPGLRRWGTSFVAARMPVRRPDQPEPSLWQIYASEDDTEVTLTAAAGVTGLPASPLVLDAGEVAEFYVGGSPTEPGDFLVDATRPVAVANYMTSQNNLTTNQTGDPAMVLLPPVEQFLPRYVVLVPTAWPTDVLVLTRPTGVAVSIDGQPVAQGEFSAVGADFEVARLEIPDGVYLLEADEPFTVSVAGMHQTGSYAYVGGLSTAVINPNPPEG
ncbi:MAG: IgGFc-binding protein [Myxococcales bacterium]|nr:IgGFc-binding protein [Myxococcales bacterium]